MKDGSVCLPSLKLLAVKYWVLQMYVNEAFRADTVWTRGM